MKFFRMLLALCLGLVIVAPALAATPKMSVSASGFRILPEPGHFNDTMYFHVSVPVTGKPAETIYGLKYLDNNTESNLVLHLLKIKGVAEVELLPYKVRVQKARVYRWEELQPLIEAAILKNLDK